MPLHGSSTVVLIIRSSKLYYTASGIITLCRWLSGACIHWERTAVLSQRMHAPDAPLPTCAPEGHLQVWYTRCCIIQFDLLTMSTQCSKHVEVYNKLIIKQDFVHLVG